MSAALLTPAQVAERLQVSEAEVIAMAAGRQIASVRLGRKLLRFHEVDVAAWQREKLPARDLIYFVQVDGGGPIKIGYTTNLRTRLSDLQCANHCRLVLLGILPGSLGDEAALHRRFAAALIHREWFQPVPELMSFITAEAQSVWVASR